MTRIVRSATHAVPNASRVPKYGSRAELDGTHYQALNFRKSGGSEPKTDGPRRFGNLRPGLNPPAFSSAGCSCAIAPASLLARLICLAHNEWQVQGGE